MSPNLDEAVTHNPFLRAGFDAWCAGYSASILLGLRTMSAVTDMQVQAMSALLGSPAAAPTALMVVPDPTPSSSDVRALEPTQRDRDLLVAVLPQDEARDAPLRMYSGSLDVVPWKYDR